MRSPTGPHPAPVFYEYVDTALDLYSAVNIVGGTDACSGDVFNDDSDSRSGSCGEATFQEVDEAGEFE